MAKVGLGGKKETKKSVPEMKKAAPAKAVRSVAPASAFEKILKRDGRTVRFEE